MPSETNPSPTARKPLDAGGWFAVILTFVFLGLVWLAVSSVYYAIVGEPNPAWTPVVEAGYASRTHLTTVAMGSWIKGEFKDCWSLNSGTESIDLTCGAGGEPKQIDVSYYGLTFVEGKDSPKWFWWRCKRTDDSRAAIECRQRPVK